MTDTDVLGLILLCECNNCNRSPDFDMRVIISLESTNECRKSTKHNRAAHTEKKGRNLFSATW